MAGRGRSTSQKKQKEIKRLEKRQDKAVRKEVRKVEPREEEELQLLTEPLVFDDYGGFAVPGK